MLNHRLIQGPLAGYSCAPYRSLFSLYTPPAYSVSEMLSAFDVVHKHRPEGRYLYRAPEEKVLCYQIGGSEPSIIAEAAQKLEQLGANLIDINCGCPKTKIRKKKAGSALLETPDNLIAIIKAVRKAIECPLTIKIRLPMQINDLELIKKIADAGVDALIVHGRRWVDDYDKPCDLQQIGRIKKAISLPIIVNGDIVDSTTLQKALEETGGDAFMIGRAATGKPWLFKELLDKTPILIAPQEKITLFMTHLQKLAALENEHQAVLQSRSLVRYYFKGQIDPAFLLEFYCLTTLTDIEQALVQFINARFKKP